MVCTTSKHNRKQHINAWNVLLNLRQRLNDFSWPKDLLFKIQIRKAEMFLLYFIFKRKLGNVEPSWAHFPYKYENFEYICPEKQFLIVWYRINYITKTGHFNDMKYWFDEQLCDFPILAAAQSGRVGPSSGQNLSIQIAATTEFDHITQ